MSKVILAKNSGFCFGVQRAVNEAIRIQKEHNSKIYTLGPLIHNNDVVKYLEENNIFSIEFEEIDKLNKGDTIVIRSHGVSETVLDTLEQKELKVINATCPFVANIQKKLRNIQKKDII
ncbi:(E)-4-hydroxy-3-methyl-but-2-enyl pyrophosphate reductase [Clostridium beijerinckii]|nr:(E)-4-hydroxy-3-methyl-but-2-enyl pyrophosphate reductase [Clostridium beijerinckii]NYB97143.1 (E)-4-hydroxy-3-methyl-but-2-enyl pyrophosphate reductase [Clostridium beijerinckii]